MFEAAVATVVGRPHPLKPHLPERSQLQRLRDRGLAIDDETQALNELGRFGYYRLSGYYYPLRETNPIGVPGRQDAFAPGASFDLVVGLADFDKRLRLLALDAIEAVEVAVRVAIAHRLGRVSPRAHLNPDLLDRKFIESSPARPRSGHAAWLAKFSELCEKSREDFWLHHLDRYGGEMPIWVAIELWDFGLLSRFYEGMQKRDRDAIAAKFVPHLDGPIFVSWLRMLNFVRNASAHHSRLWNRTLPDLAKLPTIEKCRLHQPLHEQGVARRMLFAAFSCLRLLLRSIHPGSDWHERVKAHVATFPATSLVSIESAGFYPGWENSALWGSP